MKNIKKIISLIFLLSILYVKSYSQEYLDSDKRFMKLNEISIDKDYGFSKENPIKIGVDEKAIGAYLNCLKTLDGDKIHIGDMKFNYSGQDGLTMVVLKFEQKKEKQTIYFKSPEFEQPKVIIGYLFKTINDIPKVILFPSDSIVKVTSCFQKLYSIDDFLVKEKLGEFEKPETNPDSGPCPETPCSDDIFSYIFAKL